MSDHDAQIRRIDDCAAILMFREPFIGSATCKLERVYLSEPNPITMTAAVDGKNTFYYLPWVAKLTDEELLFVQLHEALHYIFMHMFRMAGRNSKVWNLACDAVINLHIVTRGHELSAKRNKVYFKMPDSGILYDWVDNTMSAEIVYNRLMQEQPDDNGDAGGLPQDSMGDMDAGSGSGRGGDADGDGDTDAQGNGAKGKWDGFGNDLRSAPDSVTEADVVATIVAAAKLAKQAGQGSALVDRIIGGELDPVVPWQAVLRSVMQGAFDRRDYSYRRANRRYIAQGLYLPSLWAEAMGRLIIGVDTSGSISQYVLNQVAAEVTAIVQDCRPEQTDVVYCDWNVTNVETFAPDDVIKLRPKGGGGTAFKPVFDWVEASDGPPVVAMIYITDTYGNMNELIEPHFPVIWGLTEPVPHFKQPFGRVVEVFK